jgi:hypothetical protein
MQPHRICRWLICRWLLNSLSTLLCSIDQSFVMRNWCSMLRNQNIRRTKNNIWNFSSGRDDYGEKAIGFVEVDRVVNVCTVSMKVTPEHKVNTKAYSVTVTVNENTLKITKCKCDGCASSNGMF